MKSRTILFFVIFVLALAACTPVTPAAPQDTTNIPPTSTGEPSPEPTNEPETGGISLAWLASLDPQTVLLQLDYEPTFSTPEVFYEFGRIPPFTLYADGTVLYLDENQPYGEQALLAGKLTPEETLQVLQQVQDFGFAKLESHLDMCQDQGDGTQMCVADASIQIIRALQEDGTLHEVSVYAGFANEPEIFNGIVDFLTHYTHPNAQPFVPTGATLFISPLTEALGGTTLAWPLDAQILTALRPAFADGQMTAIPLTNELLIQFLAVAPHNAGFFFFTLNGQDYATTLVPWLPGMDFTAEIQQTFPAPQVEFGNPDASPTTFANCPAVDVLQAGTLRLAYISAGDLWLWDWRQEPVQITTEGDVTKGLLTADGRLTFFARKAGGSPQLWVTDNAGGEPRLLLTGKDLRGTLELLSVSFDNQWIAFVHRLPEGGGELWVAHVDGTDTRMIVSHDDLMAIVTEPQADYAYPAGVTWLPNTYTLTYDAAPGFEEEGIYIYVQSQVWVVDALTGEQGELFPAGEGGQVSYSPDGTTMLITTPSSLRAMNIEAKDLRQLDAEASEFDFFAVGFGEYYQYPALAWTPDSTALLIAQPNDESDPYNQDGAVSIWQVPLDGSLATKLGEFNGFFPSFVFSPDLAKVAYWRAAEPQSNVRELHLSTVDGAEHVLYETADLIEFQGWAPDSQSFLYVFGEGTDREVTLGNLCQPDYLVTTINGTLLRWLDADSFLYLRLDNSPFELFLGTTNGALSYLIQVEGWYGVATVGQ